MTNLRQAQTATWTNMRRVGKLRYMCMEGILAGVIMAAAMVAVAWMKAGTIGITIEAIVAFVIACLFGVAKRPKGMEQVREHLSRQCWSVDLNHPACHEARRPA